MANPGHGNPPGAWLDAPLLRHSSLPEISRARRLSGLSLTTFTSSQVQDGLLRKSTPTIDRPLVYRSLWAQDHRLQEYRPAYDSCTSSWILLEYPCDDGFAPPASSKSYASQHRLVLPMSCPSKTASWPWPWPFGPGTRLVSDRNLPSTHATSWPLRMAEYLDNNEHLL